MKNIILFLLMLLIIACSEKKYHPNLDEETLVKVVADLQLADEALKKAPMALKDSLKIVYKKQIIEIHSIDESLLELELLEMKNHPEYFKEFFDKVVERLELLENKKKSEGKADNEIN